MMINKIKIFNDVEKILIKNRLTIFSKDLDRPWGGFFVINEEKSENFFNIFFNNSFLKKLNFNNKLSPKILVIKPKKRLSWQYHNRRSEIWTVIKGNIKICKSENNNEGKLIKLKKNDQIEIGNKIRHRIIGTNDYALVAEIWIHENNDNPSDENDIVRLQDDFDRK